MNRKYRKARRTGDPKPLPVVELEHEGRVKNPFRAKGLRPDHVDHHANNPADRIFAWYMGGQDEELSETDQWYHHVYKTAHSAQINGYTDGQVVKILQKYFDLGESLAFKYLYAARTLFGNIQTSDKNAMRYMLTEMAKLCYKRALGAGDHKAAIAALKEIKSINGLDKSDAYIPDPSMLGGNTFVAHINIGQENQTSVIDLTSVTAKEEKLLTEAISQMDQAKETEIWEMIQKETEDYEQEIP